MPAAIDPATAAHQAARETRWVYLGFLGTAAPAWVGAGSLVAQWEPKPALSVARDAVVDRLVAGR
jgi:hypothetical protein